MMRLTMAALAVFTLGTVAVGTLPIPSPQDEELALAEPAPAQEVTKADWVVIFRMDVPPSNPPSPVQIFELRILTKASGEGEAAMRAQTHAQKYIAAIESDKLKFIEAQEKTGKAQPTKEQIETDAQAAAVSAMRALKHAQEERVKYLTGEMAATRKAAEEWRKAELEAREKYIAALEAELKSLHNQK